MDEIAAGKQPKSLSWKIANALVFSKIKEGLGGRIRYAISGGAPLGRDLAEWYCSVGLRIYEGYGMTETSPVVAVNTPGAFRVGSVGKPVFNIECRIADDGELLVRGPSVFHGYWNMPEHTRNAFTPDGWFKTGDVGAIDQDGFLSITDRKKDLIKTSGGKFIAPQPIEGLLKSSVYVSQAAVIGERRKFPAVIIAPNFQALEDWARVNAIPYATRAELIAAPEVRQLYMSIIDELNRNLAQFEKIKKMLIVPDEFTIESGELTPTLKLKRRVLEEKYREQIEQLYSQATDVTPEKVALGD
jgi:long-chain acyl-CoA synthetase